MLRLLANVTLSLLANAIGLLAAAWLLEGFSIESVSFIIAVGIFTLSTAILGPLVLSIAIKNATYLVGGIALVTTFVGLLITNLLSDGISIQGVDTWVFATLIIWIFSIIGNLLLPLILFKKALGRTTEE